jgi:hypothetical protein
LDTLLLHVEEQVFFSVTYIIESGVTWTVSWMLAKTYPSPMLNIIRVFWKVTDYILQW